jgi:Tfp pilus assembly protein PilP
MNTSRVGRKSRRAASTVGALALSVLVLTACGESKEEKAKAQVCNARKAISEEVTKLQGLTISSTTIEEAKKGVESIGDQLGKIKEAQPNLEPKRKEEVEAASKRFGEQLKGIATGVVSTIAAGGASEAALKAAEPKLKVALETLGQDYASALAPINC